MFNEIEKTNKQTNKNLHLRFYRPLLDKYGLLKGLPGENFIAELGSIG